MWKTATADGGWVLGEGLEDAKRSMIGLIKRRRKERMRQSKANPIKAVSVTVGRHLAFRGALCLPGRVHSS